MNIYRNIPFHFMFELGNFGFNVVFLNCSQFYEFLQEIFETAEKKFISTIIYVLFVMPYVSYVL